MIKIRQLFYFFKLFPTMNLVSYYIRRCQTAKTYKIILFSYPGQLVTSNRKTFPFFSRNKEMLYYNEIGEGYHLS